MKVFTPRNMRRKHRAKSSSGGDKKAQFKAAKILSDRYIHQSASVLANPRMAQGYAAWCERADRGTLRA